MYKPEQQIGVGHISFGDTERKYINQIMDTARVSYGPYTQAFEKKFGELHDVKHVAFMNSGTSALQVGLDALRIQHKYKKGDEVIVPATTFVATVNTVIQNGLKPVFVEVEPEYFGMDPYRIEEAVTDRTRAILPVHIGGQSADMGAVMRAAGRHRLQVVEDSCETMFAKFKGKPVGSFGDVSCFSTYVAHILTTGVGGMACTNNPETARLIRSLMNHGRDNIYISIDDDKKLQDKSAVISKRFKFDHVGYSYRATEFEGAIGLAQLDNWQENISARQRNAAKLTEGLADLDDVIQTPRVRPNSDHVFMFYPLTMRPQEDREGLVNFLERRNIETRYLLPLLNQPVYRKRWGDIESKFPVAKYLNEKAFYIGCHPGMTDQQIDYVVDVFHKYFR